MSSENNIKIFGIGLNKTGTTTLGQCGELLGFRCKSCDKGLLEDVVIRDDYSRVIEVVNQFDLFEDWPWPLIYKKLDELFPGSKFILTVRKDGKTWLDSLKKHAMRTHPTGHCRKLAYGFNYPQWHERKHLKIYKRHNEEVRAYFKGRENDFLEICWENGDGFEKLCSFLDVETPEMELPHANKASDNEVNLKYYIHNMLLSLSGQ